MKAILVKQPGGAENLFLGESPMPEIGEDEILIRVKAAALNRADILQREGKYPPPPGASPILGMDAAGIVEKTGRKTTRWKTGDRVMALLPGGAYAEFAAVPEALALPIPEKFSFEEGAAIPEVFLTAYQTLFWLGEIQRGSRVLIHAGASGVGTAAIQLAREAGAAGIFVTAGSEGKIDACLKLGATAGMNYKNGPWIDRVLELTGQKGADLILDFIGAPYWEQNLKALDQEGRLILIAAMGGVKVEKFNLLPFLAKKLHVMGTTLRSRDLNYKARLTEEFAAFALPRFESGKLRPLVDRVLPWQDAQEAHLYMEENRNVGKIVLRVS
ncbi:MAG: NAD(P)H-quinone oxidoreductase [bacterium]